MTPEFPRHPDIIKHNGKRYVPEDLIEAKDREIAELKEKLAYWQSRLSALELKQKGAEVKLR